jgi:hypothetical protein
MFPVDNPIGIDMKGEIQSGSLLTASSFFSTTLHFARLTMYDGIA